VALTGEGLLQIVLVLFIAFFLYRDGTALVASVWRTAAAG
jgi:predicted PurR-regulated permease PerM